MKIEYVNGLIFATIDIRYRGMSKTLKNVVIDTGAAESIISPDAVDDIGIFAESKDRIISYYGVGGSLHNAFVKQIEELKIGDFKLDNIKMDFGIIDSKGEINGLIGLDILIESGAIIDLKNFSLHLS